MSKPSNKHLEYEVIDDNGGGLTLFVSKGNRVIYANNGNEHCPGQLTQDLQALDTGSVPIDEWDDGVNNPTELWDEINSIESYGYLEQGYTLVAEGQSGERTLYPEDMGIAARLEFEIDDEEDDEDEDQDEGEDDFE